MLPLADRAAALAAIGDILGTSMGGSSGVLVSIFFTAAAQSLNGAAPLSKALLAGLDRMTFYGGAKVGDRTMVDALEPALKALDANGLEAAAAAARHGAEANAAMRKAKAGRSAYIGRQSRGMPIIVPPQLAVGLSSGWNLGSGIIASLPATSGAYRLV